MKRDFLSIADWTSEELWEILRLSRKLKESSAKFANTLDGKSIALIFEKPSLRTHVTFDVGIHELGGHPIYLSSSDINLGKRESVFDVAKNLEQWVNAVVFRTYAHQTCVDFAKHMKIPVINALTDLEHPCQAIGDFFTIYEKLGGFTGKKLAFIGDGNNVCHSLLLAAAKFGMDFVAATPDKYSPDGEIVKTAREAAKQTGSKVNVVSDPRNAVRDADVVYTDVWVSMGQEAERDERLAAFKNFQVNAKLMRRAKPDAIFMHCLPAHRREEVTDEVMDSPQSLVFVEAENRLPTQQAILLTILRDVELTHSRTS